VLRRCGRHGDRAGRAGRGGRRRDGRLDGRLDVRLDVRPPVAVKAAGAFRRDCGHHDNLALVAELVGSIAERLKQGDDWLEATKACRGLVGGPWWDVSGEDDPETKTRLRRVAARSAALLAASARAACEAARADLEVSDGSIPSHTNAFDDSSLL
jgi:hypothetical protein